MKDFSLEIYKVYVNAIKTSGLKFITFKEYLAIESKPEKFCLIRHDVDRKASYALKMAKLEKSDFYNVLIVPTSKSEAFKNLPEVA